MLAATATSVADALDADRSRPRWSGSSTARGSRSTDTATTSAVFTRNLNDVTDRLPDGRDGRRGAAGASFVLDGEVLGRGRRRRPPRLPGHHEPLRATSPGPAAAGLQADLLRRPPPRRRRPARRPLAERLDALAASRATGSRAGHRRSRPWPPACWTTRSPPATRAWWSRRSTAAYDAGRRGKSWRKVKPVRTLDLVVLAAEWGHGRRTGLALQPPPRRAGSPTARSSWSARRSRA